LAGALVEENLGARMPKQMHIDPEAAEAEDRRLDLRAETLRRFRSAPFTRKESLGRSAQEIGPVFPDVPGDYVDRRRRELEVDWLPILGVAFGHDQVDAPAIPVWFEMQNLAGDWYVDGGHPAGSPGRCGSCDGS
jgi:hypothetical protein